MQRLAAPPVRKSSLASVVGGDKRRRLRESLAPEWPKDADEDEEDEDDESLEESRSSRAFAVIADVSERFNERRWYWGTSDDMEVRKKGG